MVGHALPRKRVPVSMDTRVCNNNHFFRKNHEFFTIFAGLLCVSDVDECATPDNMCTHPFSECVNTIGGHFCRCRAGYQGNGTFCEGVCVCVRFIFFVCQ